MLLLRVQQQVWVRIIVALGMRPFSFLLSEQLLLGINTRSRATSTAARATPTPELPSRFLERVNGMLFRLGTRLRRTSPRLRFLPRFRLPKTISVIERSGVEQLGQSLKFHRVPTFAAQLLFLNIYLAHLAPVPLSILDRTKILSVTVVLS